MHESRNAKVSNRQVTLGDCRYQRVRFKASLKTRSRDLILCTHNKKKFNWFHRNFPMVKRVTKRGNSFF